MTIEIADRFDTLGRMSSVRVPPRRRKSPMPPIDGVDIAGKSILLRADLNTPMRANQVADRTLLRRLVPTISSMTSRGAAVVLISHLGDPNGERNPMWSLAPVAAALAAELGKPVGFAHDCVGAAAALVTRTIRPGEVVLLENLRFHPGERSNDRSFAMLLSVHADFYVNDCPSRPRRAQASTHAITELMPAFTGPGRIAANPRLTKEDT